MTDEHPPEHVLATFGVKSGEPEQLGAGWEGGWRYGEIVVAQITDHARAAWSAKVRETLFVDGLRLARPVRSTDGRYVVSGWRADTFVAGTPEPRDDEVVATGVRLHEATAKIERPRFLTQMPVPPWTDVDVFTAADRAAWEDRPLQNLPLGAPELPESEDRTRATELLAQLAGLRKPTKSPSTMVMLEWAPPTSAWTAGASAARSHQWARTLDAPMRGLFMTVTCRVACQRDSRES